MSTQEGTKAMLARVGLPATSDMKEGIWQITLELSGGVEDYAVRNKVINAIASLGWRLPEHKRGNLTRASQSTNETARPCPHDNVVGMGGIVEICSDCGEAVT